MSLFFGRCDIYEMEEITDAIGVTGADMVLKYTDIECRLVFGGCSYYRPTPEKICTAGNAQKRDVENRSEFSTSL